jgi:glycosyltransferase involved in cell wall biosynthesis
MDSTMRALVSVVIPTFNRSTLLLRALDNVRTQTYRPLEVVVADDGSVDDTYSTVDDFRKQYGDSEFFIVYASQTNKGLNAARNLGFTHSSGSFVQYLDDDDLLHPLKIERDMQLINEHNAAAIVDHVELFRKAEDLSVQLFEPARERARTMDPERRPYFAAHRWDGHIPFYSRALLESCGPFREDIRIAEGAEFPARVKVSGAKIFYSTAVMYYYQQGTQGSLTKQSGINLARGALASQEAIHDTLVRAGVADAREWRAMTMRTLRLSSRALLAGDRELAKSGLSQARVSARRWSMPVFLLLGAPKQLLLNSFSMAHRIRYLLKR